MSLARIVDALFVFLNTSIEIPLIASIEDAVLEEINLTALKDVAQSDIKYTILEFIDKGIDGTGNNVLASISSLEQNIVALRVYNFIINKPFGKNHVMSIKKTDIGGDVNLGTTSVSVVERRI